MADEEIIIIDDSPAPATTFRRGGGEPPDDGGDGGNGGGGGNGRGGGDPIEPNLVPSVSKPNLNLLEHKTRENLATFLLYLYGAFLVGSLLLVAIFVLTIIARKHTDPDIADVGPLATLASQGITALTGVVAGVIGFYFGSKSKE